VDLSPGHGLPRQESINDPSTAWVSALLHFRAPTDPQAIRELVSRWRRIEADDRGPYAGLRKEARGIRLFEPLWERQRAAVSELRRAHSGERRPNLAMWTCGVCHFHAPRSTDEARELLRDWRLLLAGDQPAAEGTPALPAD
jgi:hypothetical protein